MRLVQWRMCGRRCIAGGLVLFALADANADPVDAKVNYFGDPFLRATSGIPECPTPEGPEITKAQMLAESHYRADRGVNCYQAGRCRLPNSYLYDAEIIPRAKRAIEASGRFSGTSVWLEGQRRWVWLKGCVRQEADSVDLERLVRGLDDVEAVINELEIWPVDAASGAAR